MHCSIPRSYFVRLFSIALIALAVGAASCSKKDERNPVTGKVLYKGDPIKGAVVTFHPKGETDPAVHRPNGMTGDDGAFALSSGLGEGAAVGEYVVTIYWPKASEQPAKKFSTEPPPDPVDGLDGRYADMNKSTILVEVKSGKNNLEPFKLE